jgi:HK97 family phage portal protein
VQHDEQLARLRLVLNGYGDDMALRDLFSRREERALPTNIDPYQITARPLFSNYTGEVINEANVFASSAMIAAVTLLADSVATMPLELMRDTGGRWERLPTPDVLRRPNDDQLMFDFVHQTVVTLAIHGVDFVYAPTDRTGMPLELRNLNPLGIKHAPNDDGTMLYQIGNNKELFGKDVIRQIDWLRLPGQWRGISPIDAMRNIIGTDISINRYLAAFYGDGATPSSVLETENQLTPDQAQVLRDTWTDMHYKTRKPAVLSGGLKWRPIAASASDMDTMAHRESIVRDIARAYRIPLHLINGTGGDSQTYQNVESAGINFVRHTLLPYMRRIEGAISELLPPDLSVRFNADEYLRADLATRVRASQIQISSGMLTPNEARHIEGREPYDGGDNFTFLPTGVVPPLGSDKERPA